MVWLGPGLVFLARVALGVLLAALLSAIGIVVAWGMFIFWGGVSPATLLALFMTGAGVGAGIGSFSAWLRIDLAPRAPVLAARALVLFLSGIGGAWGGFQFGATREVACCAGPAIQPLTYMALGAIIVANGAALAVHMIDGIGRRRDWPGFRAGVPVPPPVRPAGHD